MKISLCMIVGNEERHIGRCLKHFAPAFDELCMVEAIGNQDADRTYAIARDFCQANGKEFIFEKWENSSAETRQWPHIDDFAGARNYSYEIATGDFLFWCDADDIMSPDGVRKLRELIESQEADIYALPYAVGPDRIVMRDKVTRKGVGRWRRAIHERLEFTDEERKTFTSKYVREIGSPTFLHKPIGGKSGSFERNVRMLDHRINGVWEDLFYLQEDYFIAREYKKVVEIGKTALGFPMMRDTERYGILCNLAIAEETSELRLPWALEAIKLCPSRREAIYTAANICCDMGRFEDALAYVRMYSHLPRPEDPAWNHRDAIYDHTGVEFGCQVLRLNGLEKKALESEQAMFKARGAKISILHATRGRPEQCIETRREWMQKSVLFGAVEHIFAVDHDDTAVLEEIRGFRHVVVNPGGTTPRAYNAAAKASLGKILILASDDVHPPDGWDALVWSRLGDRVENEAVLGVSDGHRTDKLLCVQIMTRKRYEAQGEAFSEEYPSMFADNEFTHRAYRDKIVVEARDIVFEHRHPSFTGDPNWKDADATYAHANASENYKLGEEVFRRRNPDAFEEPAALDTIPSS